MSPDSDTLHDCLSLFRPGDYLLLLDSGVNLLAHAGKLQAVMDQAGGSLGASAPDLAARGLGDLTGGVAVIDDAQWLELLADHAQVLSWK